MLFLQPYVLKQTVLQTLYVNYFSKYVQNNFNSNSRVLSLSDKGSAKGRNTERGFI
jgi:hypothetical protein